MGSRDSLVAQLLLKSRMKSNLHQLMASQVVDDFTSTDHDSAIDLSQQSKGLANQKSVNRKQKGIASNLPENTPKHPPEVIDLIDAPDAPRYGILKCTLCPYIAESARVLFKHYNYHKQVLDHKSQNSNKPDDCQNQTAATKHENSIHPTKELNKCNTPTSEVNDKEIQAQNSLSLRELLQRNDPHASSSTQYVKSIVKAVMSGKHHHVLTDMSTSHQIVETTTSRHKLDNMENTVTAHHISEENNDCWSPSNADNQVDCSEYQSLVIKKDPNSRNETFNSESSDKHQLDDYLHPEPIEGYFPYGQNESIQKPNKRKCRPVRLSERNSSTDKRAKHSSPSSTCSSSYTSMNLIHNSSTTRDRAIQCEIIKPNQGTTSSNRSSQLTEAEECGHVSSSVNQHECEHCGITFSDEVLHSVHMGCHSLGDVFSCNVCGKQCRDKYGFYIHIMRGHQYT